MPATIRSRKDQEQDDLKLAKKLKPRLRKFLIDEQTKTAEKIFKAAEDEVVKLAKMESFFKDVVKQARKLSQIAFLEDRVWVEHSPAVEMH